MSRGGSPPRILVLALDTVGAEMAGPAIRASEIARVLSRHGSVTLLATGTDPAGDWGFPVGSYDRHDDRSLRAHLKTADVVVAQPQWPLIMDALRASGARLVFDLYDPEPLETLEHSAGMRASARRGLYALTADRAVEALRIGHFFCCANRPQRDLWVGAMLGAGLLGPRAYDGDRSFASRIALVPMGVPAESPRPGARPPWLAIEGIGEDDEVVLWNGGLWRWFDAATAIRSVAELARRRDRLRLVFMGASSKPAAAEATASARGLAAQLDVLDRHVFFNDAWVPYARRGEWLLAASCALACYPQHLETHFAFRTRVLDCFWAGLPVVCTRGDSLSEEIEREGLGETVPEADPAATAAALERVLDAGRQPYAAALGAAAERYRWSRVVEPLADFVTEADAPRPLGAGLPRRPGHLLRHLGYRGARRTLGALGVSGLPGRP